MTIATKTTVPDVLPLAVEFLRANPAGCCLHVMLSDPNFEQVFAEGCLEYAKENGHPECTALAQLMVAMSTTQRKKIHARAWGELYPRDRE